MTDNSELQTLVRQVIEWHIARYPQITANTPSKESMEAITLLCKQVLLPLKNQYGDLIVTYGFTSPTLLREIKKLSPKGIAPLLDQHASHEVNANNKPHCTRLGASCDITIPTHLDMMDEVADWVSLNLPFDRLYFYGKTKPIHISFGPDNSKFIQIMKTSATGKRTPLKNGVNTTLSSIWRD